MTLNKKKRIAVIGGGISGLTTAWKLNPFADVTLYEANNYLGGHTNTVDMFLEGHKFPVDTGFLVYNERTYPHLIQLFKELKVETVESDMSFSINLPELGLEWAGTNLKTVFAQRKNLLSRRFIRMLFDILRFNKQATALVKEKGRSKLFKTAASQDLGTFLQANNYSQEFKDWYLIPMAAAIWSCPAKQMLSFPLATFIQFCHNHGLLQVENRPKWFTVKNGARNYVEKMRQNIQTIHTNCPVQIVNTFGDKPILQSSLGTAEYDYIVLACHSDQALRMLEGNTEQTEQLKHIKYQDNIAYLHTDINLMPQTQKTWSSWNYTSNVNSAIPSVSVTYWCNKLQPLPVEQPVLVSLNPIQMPQTELIHREIRYSHPIFDQTAIEAQDALKTMQGLNGIYMAGAWMKYGFHEDGHTSGLLVADNILKRMHQNQCKVA